MCTDNQSNQLHVLSEQHAMEYFLPDVEVFHNCLATEEMLTATVLSVGARSVTYVLQQL
jgi:hypothetical protein